METTSEKFYKESNDALKAIQERIKRRENFIKETLAPAIRKQLQPDGSTELRTTTKAKTTGAAGDKLAKIKMLIEKLKQE